MANVSKTFVDEKLWPEFVELNKVLQSYLEEITDKIISQNIHRDLTDAQVVKQLNAN